MALQLAQDYCRSKNIKGFSEKALGLIGQELQKFDQTDADGNGTLDAAEVLQMMKNDDYHGFMTETDAEEFLGDLDKDGDGKIDREEFVQKSVLRWANSTYMPQLARLSKGGTLPRDKFLEVFLSEDYSKTELNAFIDANGLDSDGKVDYKKFVRSFFDLKRQ